MASLVACGSSRSDLSQQDKIERLLEGTYELSSWNDGEDQFAPPTVKGRITFYDGTIVFILHNNIEEDKQRQGDDQPGRDDISPPLLDNAHAKVHSLPGISWPYINADIFKAHVFCLFAIGRPTARSTK